MSEKWLDEGIATRANRTPEQRKADAREAEAQRELAPMPACPNCGESRQDHLWPLGSEVRCDECGQRYKCEPMPSQAQRIAKLEARVDELHAMIEEITQGGRHLAGRIDRAELRTITLERAIERLGKGWCQDRQKIDKAEEAREDHHLYIRDLYRQMRRWRGELDAARKRGDDEAEQRLRARAIELGRRLDKQERLGLVHASLQCRTADLLATFIDKKVTDAVPSAGKPTIQQQCDAVEFRGQTEEDNRE